MITKTFQQGRSEQEAESYSLPYVEALSDARTKLEVFFSIQIWRQQTNSTILADYQTHGPALWSRFNAGYEDQVWYFRGCVKALQGGPESLVRELDLAVQQLEGLAGCL